MRRLICFAALSTLALAGCREGEGFVQLSPPLVIVNVDSVDFGEVPNGFRVSRDVTVLNGGDLALEVSAVRVDGRDFEVLQGIDAPIEAGEEAMVRVAFAPDGNPGVREGALVIESNANNAPTKSVSLTGTGVLPTQCGNCSSPPPTRCLTANDSVSYAETGTCVNDECEYTATVTECSSGCDSATGLCAGAPPPDGGVEEDAGVAMDADVDAGVVIDAGAPDSGAPDTGVPDTGAPDTGAPDTGAPDTGVSYDAGPSCGDAGVTDSGLGAPAAVFVAPGVHSFAVPSGVGSVLVRAWGGGGQGGNQAGATGGGGAFVQANLTVSPGESLEVLVAEGGGIATGGLGNGGGASYVRRASTELVVAAGGGGGGSDGNSGRSMAGGQGGAGGLSGEPGGAGVGAIPPYCTSVTGGTGATQTAAGVGGTATGSSPNLCAGQPGARNSGGRATGSRGNCDTQPGAELWEGGGGQANGGGGGGGSGYFGGGGAGFIWTYCGGGGGGGASWTDPGASGVAHEGGAGAVPGRPTEGYGAGRGGDRCLGGAGVPPCTCNEGGNGRVELYY